MATEWYFPTLVPMANLWAASFADNLDKMESSEKDFISLIRALMSLM